MTKIETVLGRDERVEVYRSGECTEDGACVLYWMQRAQRGRDNLALDAAITLGNQLHMPVLTLFVLTEYPEANLRHYQFMLEGLEETAHVLGERGTPLVIRQGDPPAEVIKLACGIKVAAVIGDECELRLPRVWRQIVKRDLSVPFACVDADVMIPHRHMTKEEWGAYTIRPKIQRLLPRYLQPMSDAESEYPLAQPPCNPGEAARPTHLLSHLKIDRTVQPSRVFRGGQREGMQRLERFIHERLSGYSEKRNIPELDGTSQLSAYLHFGQISIQRVVWEVECYVASGAGSAHIDLDGGRAAYLEELIVRRELAVNFAWFNEHYDSLAGCPDWARKTLQKHAQDPREWEYSREELEQARTHDELWNASQREMVVSGRMHGYMRMYWAKKILEWMPSPEEAFETAVYLNDKYELDGRDANGYTGISWAIGGRHDRPWRERQIFGQVRYMALSGMKKKMDVAAYTYKWQ
ncbi:deoxyribodipyrimidine photo-lyase [Ktedonospora formicarum]|uniref:Deoxyribodipyrimidine photo-lyase n=1 Tax=Ktedonospora formicarum TaxID=2778364 RepID=A0A8J3I0Z0_9CHLR|nr:deoxyribodipyrimidine photo-lyase [Ktedonospora formicarum]GHO44790.1 deoxyribodipyrimidine photo-lyase [Ktedonospora formicarum]